MSDFSKEQLFLCVDNIIVHIYDFIDIFVFERLGIYFSSQFLRVCSNYNIPILFKLNKPKNKSTNRKHNSNHADVRQL